MDQKRVSIILISIVVITSVTVVIGFATISSPITASGFSDRNATSTGPFVFTEVSNQTGLEYMPDEPYDHDTNSVTNAGVFTADYDNDGWTDVLLTGGTRPVLYRNREGTFEPSGALSGIDRSVQTALFFDYDADGWKDLLLLSKHRKPLVLENKNGSFNRADIGLDQPLSIPTGASAADYTRNGCLDLLIIQSGNWSQGNPKKLTTSNASVPDNGGRNRLYRGNCSNFTAVTKEANIGGAHWSLAASFVDVTNDRYPDIHVANDFNKDVLYINQKNGTFERKVLGEYTDRNAMASEIADLNGDNRVDIFVTNIFYPPDVAEVMVPNQSQRSSVKGNNLLINQGNGSFTDRASEYNVRSGGWGWAAVIADLDNDADLDIVHTTMRLPRDIFTRYPQLSNEKVNLLYKFHPYYQRPAVFQRTGDRYVVSNEGPNVFSRSDSRGIAQLDFDMDGDVDLLVTDAEGHYKLYENQESDNHAVQIDLEGNSGRSAVGARVYVSTNNKTALRIHNMKSDFLSQDSRVLHFGVENAERVDVRVVWSDGSVQRFTGTRTDQRLVITPDGIGRRIDLKACSSGDNLWSWLQTLGRSCLA